MSKKVDEVNRGVARRGRLRVAVALLLVLATAGFFRLWHIGSLPPGLFGDEAVNGLDALDVLAGRGQVFFPANYGREGLHMFIIAAFFRLFGVSALALRLPSVLAGILTALATYWLGCELFRSNHGRLSSTVPLLAALWLATAYWHVHFSRFGIRGVYTPLCGALAFAAFWRGVNHAAGASAARGTAGSISQVPPGEPSDVDGLGERPPAGRTTSVSTAGFKVGLAWPWFLLTGLFLGLASHFYTAGRLYPFFLGLFLLVQWAVARLGQPSSQVAILPRHFGRVAALYAVAALVFAPLAWYFVTHPGSFAQRASTVVAFGQEGSPWLRIGQAVLGNVAQFFWPGRGDTAWFYNLPGRALLEALTALLTVTGLVICLRRWRQGPYLFLLLWWPVMMLPAFLAVDRVPTAPRVLGVMPSVYFFPAVAMAELLAWAARRVRAVAWQRAGVAALLSVPLVVAGMCTAWDYFAVWGPSAQAYEAFDGEMVDAARWLKANPQEPPVYVSAGFYRHASFSLLYSQTPTTEFFVYQDPTVRWCYAPEMLPLPPSGASATYVLAGTAMPEAQALAHYLPGHHVEQQINSPAGQPSVTIVRAEYSDTKLNAADVSMTDQVSLTGYDISGEARPGYPLEVALYWAFAGPEPESSAGYGVELALIDGTGRRWPSGEDVLSYRPAEWDPGSRAVSWHGLSLPAEAPTGGYSLGVRLTNGETGNAVGDWATMVPYAAEPEPSPSAVVLFDNNLELLEASVHLEEVPGGEQLVVELLLEAQAQLAQSYTLFLHALDADGQRIGQRDSATGGGLNPTDGWIPGRAWRDVYRVPISVQGARRPYRLALGFYDWRTGARLAATGADGKPLPDNQYLLGL